MHIQRQNSRCCAQTAARERHERRCTSKNQVRQSNTAQGFTQQVLLCAPMPKSCKNQPWQAPQTRKPSPNPSKSLPERQPSHPRGSQGHPGRPLKACRHGPGTLLEAPRAAPMIPGDAPGIPKDHPRPPEGTKNCSLAQLFGKRLAGRVRAWIFDRFSLACSKSGPS